MSRTPSDPNPGNKPRDGQPPSSNPAERQRVTGDIPGRKDGDASIRNSGKGVNPSDQNNKNPKEGENTPGDNQNTSGGSKTQRGH